MNQLKQLAVFRCVHICVPIHGLGIFCLLPLSVNIIGPWYCTKLMQKHS